ncbi:MAG: GNAT family N-acetyltransferase [Erythrobacter sp.]|jgi:putative acetyltransferase|nr:GNAT family N-acetyltransferase [Erythrobacter sp.]
MAYAIRPFRNEDARALARLTIDAIRAIGARRYSAQQVEAWAARPMRADRFIERADSGALIFVAADHADDPIAYALLEEDPSHQGHLDMLYCAPAHTRLGIADELLAHAEHQARTRGIERLFTEASELARPAFERAGYKTLHRRDFTIEHGGSEVPIHNYAMEKRLT